MKLILTFDNSETNPNNVWHVAREVHDLTGTYWSTIGPSFRTREHAAAFKQGLEQGLGGG